MALGYKPSFEPRLHHQCERCRRRWATGWWAGKAAGRRDCDCTDPATSDRWPSRGSVQRTRTGEDCWKPHLHGAIGDHNEMRKRCTIKLGSSESYFKPQTGWVLQKLNSKNNFNDQIVRISEANMRFLCFSLYYIVIKHLVLFCFSNWLNDTLGTSWSVWWHFSPCSDICWIHS